MRTKPRAKDPWEARFEALLADDCYAQKIFARLIKKGTHRRRLVLVLEAATDPNTGWRFQRVNKAGKAQRRNQSAHFILLPTKQMGEHLARSLREAATEIRHFWLRTPFAFFPPSKTALETANVLDQQATVLDQVNWKAFTKRLGYKAFWHHLPLALLCLELQVPGQSSYAEASQLAAVALRAWNRPDTDDDSFSPDAIRKRYERFCKREAGRGSIAFLEVFLKFMPPD